MTYTKQTWVDGVAGNTPINAAALNHMEDGISTADAKGANVQLARFTGTTYTTLTTAPKMCMGKFNLVFNAISYALYTLDYTVAGFTELPQLFLTIGGENGQALYLGYDQMTNTSALIVARSNANVTATVEASFLAMGR